MNPNPRVDAQARGGAVDVDPTLLAAASDAFAAAAGLKRVHFVTRVSESWRPLGDATDAAAHIQEATPLLNSCETETSVCRGEALAAMQLPTRIVTPCYALWQHRGSDAQPRLHGSIDPLQAKSWLASMVDAAASAADDSQRCRRLGDILDASTAWIGFRDLGGLLQKLATDATKLFDADRASVFLIDRAKNQLVGYPALGFDGEPLRVAATAGVVGAVFQSGLPRRWCESDPRDEVNRHVDASSGYQTRCLLAVPLLLAGGKPIGVLELLNATSGEFSRRDEQLLQYLAAVASAAIESMKQVQELLQCRPAAPGVIGERHRWIGSSAASTQLLAELQGLASTDLPVLLVGENGTGKEVAARQLHARSRRSPKPFVAVNCAAIAETLLESELFGHQRGAFTDAYESRAGQFELASGGTLMLDEIGDMSPAGQAKLLRVLETQTLTRVGGSDPIRVDVRIVAATNQDLPELIAAGRFRIDLYYRLAVAPLRLPPLRERPGDIGEIASHYLEHFCQSAGRSPPRLSPAAVMALQSHPWPGNVRELRNLMQRLAALHGGEIIEAEDIRFVNLHSPSAAPQPHQGDAMSLSDATDEYQRELIRRRIAASGDNMTAAAESLGLQRSNLYRKMKQLGMGSRGS